MADPPASPGVAAAAGAGAVLRAADGTILAWDWQRLPPLTNNEAEYAGLLLGLTLARNRGLRILHCFMDSEVVVGQMQGRFSVHSFNLRRWHDQATASVRQFQQVTFVAIPRECNQIADALANEALAAWPPQPSPHRAKAEAKDAPEPTSRPVRSRLRRQTIGGK